MTLPSTMVLTLDIDRAGEVSSFEAMSERMLVGSGSHCDVRLRPEEADDEELVIEVREGAIYGRAVAQRGAVLLGGVRFDEGYLALGAVLTLGELSLGVGLRSEDKRTGSKRGDGATRTTLIRALLLAGIAIGGYKLIDPQTRTGVLDQVVAAAPLFAHTGPGECNVEDSREAAFQAQRWNIEASLRQERAPFYARDGVASVELYRSAEACFRKAGLDGDAERAGRTLRKLRADLEDEFHVRQVRLERFLGMKKHDHAQQEIYVLQSFVHHQDGPYVQWLAAVQRELNARFARAERGR